MTTNAIDKIINDAKNSLSEKVKSEIKTSDQQTNQIFDSSKDAFIRLLESEAGAGHFEVFLKIYNGIATNLSVTQIISLMEHFYAKKLRDNLKLSNLEATKAAQIISPFIIKQIATKKSNPAKDIKTLCSQIGLDSYIADLEALKKRWDDLSPEEKKQFSH